jgi:hypothetical protein
VDLPDRLERQRSGAPGAAVLSHVGVELVDRWRGERPQRQVADPRDDVALDVAPVALERGSSVSSVAWGPAASSSEVIAATVGSRGSEPVGTSSRVMTTDVSISPCATGDVPSSITPAARGPGRGSRRVRRGTVRRRYEEGSRTPREEVATHEPPTGRTQLTDRDAVAGHQEPLAAVERTHDRSVVVVELTLAWSSS